jgi:16S rRNA (cytidine1402-2'-O)-methyltransferase
MPGSLFLVATPIGNLEDITLRALRVLKDVDLIAAEDTRRTAHLLGHFGITTKTTSLHAHNEQRRVPELVAQVAAGLRLAVVTDAGMPGVADPGYLIVRQALDAGLTVEVVPGVSALTTALAGSGLPSEEFLFLGFAPARAAERRRWVGEQVAGECRTVAILEAPGRIRGLLADLFEVLGDRHVVIARELTKLHESWQRGRLSELTGHSAPPERGEFVILVSAQKCALPDAATPADEDVSACYRKLAADAGDLSRREIVKEVARKFAIPPKAVYAIVEKTKSSV